MNQLILLKLSSEKGGKWLWSWIKNWNRGGYDLKTESADLTEFIQETNEDSVDIMTGQDDDDESRRKEEEEEEF